ncbi:MAG: porin family protein [Candidatus Cyclobacteriaceae bacterium M3_2C_046]
MKKHLIVSFLLIFSTNALLAQTPRFGVKGGLNLSNLAGDLDGTQFKASFQGGLMLNLQITDQYALQPELIYSRQGANLEDSDFRYNIQYLNIPVVGKFFLSEGFNLQVAPQVGILLDSKLTDGDTEYDISDNTKSLELAVGLGAGYQMNNLTLDVRYNMGLTNSFDAFEIDTILGTLVLGDDITVTNQVIQVSVGYLF